MSDPIAPNPFRAEALKIPPDEVPRKLPRQPGVIVGHGKAVAAAVRQYWHSEAGRAGFDQTQRMSPAVAERIDALCDALDAATYALALDQRAQTEELEAARALNTQLRRELRFVVAAPGAGAAKAKLQALARQYPRREVHRLNVAASLKAHAMFIRRNLPLVQRESMRYSPDWIEKAEATAEALRAEAWRSKDALDLRNRVFTLLLIELRAVRRIADYLWRVDHPKVFQHFRVLPPRPKRGEATQPEDAPPTLPYTPGVAES